VAFFGLLYPYDQRRAILLHGHFGAVSGKDLYGSKEPSYLPGAGAILNMLRPRLGNPFNEFLAASGLF
jgi:hypothetical protein